MLRFVKNPLFENNEQQNETAFAAFKEQLKSWIREGVNTGRDE